LDDFILARIESVLSMLDTLEPDGFALAHGDLHSNNALVRGDDVVLFDKAPGVWVAPPVFDLAVIYSEAFPGARYVKSDARAPDHDWLAAFMSGYDALPAEELIWLDHFVLVRSLRRYPNPFVPELLSIIEAALSRCEAYR
jgi:Ser/Thr protein kinase RdoA (MazF antagonist)